MKTRFVGSGRCAFCNANYVWDFDTKTYRLFNYRNPRINKKVLIPFLKIVDNTIIRQLVFMILFSKKNFTRFCNGHCKTEYIELYGKKAYKKIKVAKTERYCSV